MNEEGEMPSDFDLSISSVAAVIRGSLEIAEGGFEEGNDDLFSEPGCPNFTSPTISDTNEESFVSPIKAYATLEDFGSGRFPEDANEAILDYFSGPIDDVDASTDGMHLTEENQPTDDFEINVDERESTEPGHSTTEDGPSCSMASVSQNTKEDEVDIFLSTDCCSKICNKKFKKELISTTRLCAIENDYRCSDRINHLHLILIGQLSALTIQDETAVHKNVVKEREKQLTKYMFRGHGVCQKFFQFVNNVGERRLRTLKQRLKDFGLEPKVHGMQGRPPKHTTSQEKIQEFKTFLTNYCEVHALVLPGKTPQYRIGDPTLRVLPSSCTKVEVYKQYKAACTEPVLQKLFERLWNLFFPNVVIQKPRTDLCPECYRNTIQLGKLHGLNEQDKMALLKKSQEHLERVAIERNIYREATKRVDSSTQLCKSIPCTFKGKMHYSFDFAQQIFLPYDSQQVGPLYFLTPFKVSLFGVACEPLGKFVLYLIPESVVGAGKGSNMVISLLHHFFENFGVGENEVYCHADNCAGQNKNNYLMQYAVWRTLCGLHRKFQLSFLPVGHTKFAPDLYFGCVKRAYRRSSVHSLQDLKVTIEASCGKNITTFFVANENGDMNLKLYNWQQFFKDKKAERVPSLLENYHFESSEDVPGTLRYRKSVDEKPKLVQVFPADVVMSSDVIPSELNVTGLSAYRRKYLHDKIREFVREDSRDTLCPLPSETQEEIDDVAGLASFEDPSTISTAVTLTLATNSTTIDATATTTTDETTTTSIDATATTTDVTANTTTTDVTANTTTTDVTANTTTTDATSTTTTTTTSDATTNPDRAASSSKNEIVPGTEKKARKASRCGYCHKEGHTNRLDRDKVAVCPKRREDEGGNP